MRLLEISNAEIAFGACALLTITVVILAIRWIKDIQKIRHKNPR
jgi:hypothetical protein